MNEKISAEMLEYIDMLKKVDTEGVEPMTHVFAKMSELREDVVTGTDRSEAILKNAPQKKNGMFVVPRTIG